MTDAEPADGLARLFATRLVERREARGMKQRDLAYRLDVGEREVYRWEAGTPRGPKIQTLRALSIALETSVDYLLGLTDDPEPRVTPGAGAPRGPSAGLILEAARGAVEHDDDRPGRRRSQSGTR